MTPPCIPTPKPHTANTVAASRGSQYLEALITAIREERAAARGGPRPFHAQLRDLGYLGWSALVSSGLPKRRVLTGDWDGEASHNADPPW